MLRKFLEFSFEFSFVVIFITLFFFTIGIKLEHDSTDRQLSNLVNDLYATLVSRPSDIAITLLTDKKNVLKTIVQNKEDTINIEKTNDLLLRNFIIILSSILVLILILWYKYARIYKINVPMLILQNIILFLCVGSFEYYFFSNYVSKYIPLTPTEVKEKTIRKISEKIKNTAGIDTKSIAQILYMLGITERN